MKEVLAKAVAEVKARVSKDNIGAGVEVNEQTIKQSLDLIKGATTIVWPMGLPPTDPVRLELENCEELQGTQESKMVLDPAKTTLWFATKELTREKKLKDFLGKNEKTKVCALCELVLFRLIWLFAGGGQTVHHRVRSSGEGTNVQ